MELDERRIAAYFLMNVGHYCTSYRVVKKTGAYYGNMENMGTNDLFEMNDKVFEIAEKYGFELDNSHHDMEEIGLPWNIDYLIKQKK